jgi:plastocyanin
MVEIPGIKFAQKKLIINEGDSVEFKNTSTVNHMVNTFDQSLMWNLGDQKPGQSVFLPQAPKLVKGKTYEIQCGYHQDMKLIIEVN